MWMEPFENGYLDTVSSLGRRSEHPNATDSVALLVYLQHCSILLAFLRRVEGAPVANIKDEFDVTHFVRGEFPKEDLISQSLLLILGNDMGGIVCKLLRRDEV